VTRWQPAQITPVGRFASNCVRIDGSGVLTIWTANWVKVLFWPGPRPWPKVTVLNRCYHCRCAQVCCSLLQVLQGATKLLSGTLRCCQSYLNYSNYTAVPVSRERRYSDGQPECPPRVSYSLEIDVSMFRLQILLDTPAVWRWVKYILLMYNWQPAGPFTKKHINLYFPKRGPTAIEDFFLILLHLFATCLI
jgi:hypothetical protein